jgi:penicillin amidase
MTFRLLMMPGALLWFAGLLLAQDDDVEILRDTWGIPHIFSDTDAGAFYGLGYATSEDRAFQMTYSLRIIQGRLSEVIGEVRKLNRDETSIDHDRKMRTFGFYRAAQRTAPHLDRETLGLLQAYCDGVNAYFREHQDKLHPLFARTGLQSELWTPADCLASWWHLGQFFATDGTRDLIAGRNEAAGQAPGRGARGQPPGRGSVRGPVPPVASADIQRMPPDDGPAVVKRTDVSAEWVDRTVRYAREHGLTGGNGAEGPKLSHAWVVGGKRTTTGSSVLVSDPQTQVRNPSLFYEFHVRGKTFNARGIGVPGSPIILIGFTDRVAWGVTALGADQGRPVPAGDRSGTTRSIPLRQPMAADDRVSRNHPGQGQGPDRICRSRDALWADRHRVLLRPARRGRSRIETHPDL